MPERAYRVNDWCLVVFLLSATVYNAQNTGVRLVMILLLLVLPAILFLSRRCKLEKHIFHYMFVSALWVGYFLLWLIYNLADFRFDFSGPNVEMMTPFLYLSTLYTLPMIASYDLARLRWSVKRFLKLYVGLLVIDVFARLALEPDCFMNYSCRFEAKTVGYFATTNALATSLVAVTLAGIIVSLLNLRIKGILSFVLLSSMARAAIVAAIISYLGYLILCASKLRRLFMLIAFGALFLVFAVVDPLDFRGDGSLISKFDFFFAGASLLANGSPEQIIFGFGANFESVTGTLGVNGWSPHAPMLKGFLYFGVIGLLLHLYSLYAAAKLNRLMFIPVFGFFVLGLAGAPLFFPTFLVAYAILRLAPPVTGDTLRRKAAKTHTRRLANPAFLTSVSQTPDCTHQPMPRSG